MQALSPKLRAYKDKDIEKQKLHYQEVNYRYNYLVIKDNYPKGFKMRSANLALIGQSCVNRSYALEVRDQTRDTVAYLLQPYHENEISFYYRTSYDFAFEENRKHYVEVERYMAGRKSSLQAQDKICAPKPRPASAQGVRRYILTYYQALNTDWRTLRWRPDYFTPTRDLVRSYAYLKNFRYK